MLDGELDEEPDDGVAPAFFTEADVDESDDASNDTAPDTD